MQRCRDWKAIAALLGERCPREDKARVASDISSHAQKHFIKLCLAGEVLPPKVSCDVTGVRSGSQELTASAQSKDQCPAATLCCAAVHVACWVELCRVRTIDLTCVPQASAGTQVAESGAGYTLSGALLNPYSSSATSYGLSVKRYESVPLVCCASLELPTACLQLCWSQTASMCLRSNYEPNLLRHLSRAD